MNKMTKDMAKSSGGIEPRKGMIRNSTADFLLFTQQSGEQSIEVRLYNENVWLTQRAMSVLYNVDRTVVTKHLRNIFEEGELSQDQVSARFAHTALLQRVSLKNIESSKIAIS